MSFHLLLHLRQQLLQYQTQQQLPHKTRRKSQEKMKPLLEHVVGNSGAFLSPFQESTNLLKNMDKIFAALLEKF